MEQQQFEVGTVIDIASEKQLPGDRLGFIQTLTVKRQQTNDQVTVQAGSAYQPLSIEQKLSTGRTILISPQQEQGQTIWVLVDSTYRLPYLAGLCLLFFAIVMVVARKQGILSILGMIGSIAVLMLYIIPAILAGANPMIVSVVSSLAIGSLSMYLSHGWSVKSHVALGSIVLTLVVVIVLSSITLSLAGMSGMGSEEAVFVQLEPSIQISMRGLFLAGIVLGALGILDDITISQVSIVKQLIKAKPQITFQELFMRGMEVGKDHIASLVNTLVLAYAATSLPLFLLLKLNNTRPLWVMLNDEMIAEEVVRTLSGSIGLVLAVPLTTFLAATIFLKQRGQRP